VNNASEHDRFPVGNGEEHKDAPSKKLTITKSRRKDDV